MMMQQQILKIKKKFAKDKHLSEIAKQSAYSFGMRVIGLLVNYLFLFFVTRYYGAKGWGIFAICFSILQIVSMIGSMGINVALVKLIPQGNINLKQLYIKVLKFVVPLNLVLSLILFVCSNMIGHILSTDGITISKYIQIASLGILPYSVSMINSGIFRGNKEIVRFSFYDSLGRFLWGGLCVLILHFFTSDVYSVITGFIAGQYVLFFVSIKGVRKILDSSPATENSGQSTVLQYSIKELLKLSLPLFWANFIFQGSLWSTTLILGMYLSKEQVGIFDATNRLASLITIILYAINSISAPKFAESVANKELLKNNVQASSKIIFFATIPLCIIMLIGGPFVFDLLGYTTNRNYDINIYLIFLIILMGQLVNNLSGSVGILMQMTGYHLLNQNISLVSFIFTTLLLFFVTPVYGLVGASVIVGLNIAFKNIASVIVVYKKMNILTIYYPLKK